MFISYLIPTGVAPNPVVPNPGFWNVLVVPNSEDWVVAAGVVPNSVCNPTKMLISLDKSAAF